jgi:hypothetical protein
MNDALPRELARLEATLAKAEVPKARVIDELSNMRQELARGSDRGSELRLPHVRVASPCKERWADMAGDDRVRVCNGCDRPVFNLSEMTREQAEGVLATRGITPCVRFYRRTDGTIMTADCPTGARRSRRLAVVAAGTTLLSTSAAMAEPPPPPVAEDSSTESGTDEGDPDDPAVDPVDPNNNVKPTEQFEVMMGVMIDDGWRTHPARPAIQWSSWIRGSYGVRSWIPNADASARSTMPPSMLESESISELALGADLSLGLALYNNLRLGAWAETRTASAPVFGGELIMAPREHVGTVLRVGGNGHVITTALGFGYTGTDPSLSHHATGARIVASITRSFDDTPELVVTIGIEFDPIGALGHLVRAVTD